MKKVSKPYRQWSEQEINQIIYHSKQFNDQAIDWTIISSHIKGRTNQQCKSFYNNRIRKFQFETDFQRNKIQDLADSSILYLLTFNNNEDKVQQTLIDNYMFDIFSLIQVVNQNKLNFVNEKDLNILKLIREIIIVYNQHKSQWIKQIKLMGVTDFKQQLVQPQQLRLLISFMDGLNCDNLFLQISGIISEQIK
ncbi:Myb-like_DNA-binding domain-containing protein [Hexamita inflata]|uniref:Myb-like DNA-binding domain-containing protein n=1 Tax=Hexamita inflata TaxID=28002 RepID=A0AA86RJN6_9EUKA|nr:Myb-like DNA-binding domain-containing protein [Hexamita inflata]